MAFCILEDLQGEVELIVFPSALEKCASLLKEGEVLLVSGTAQLREALAEDGEDELKLLVRAVRRAEPGRRGARGGTFVPQPRGGVPQNHRCQRREAGRGA